MISKPPRARTQFNYIDGLVPIYGKGENIRDAAINENPIFFLGDHDGFGKDDTASGDLFGEGDIRVGTNLGSFNGPNYTGTVIEYNVIGAGPTVTTFVDPGYLSRSLNGIAIFGPDNGIIRYNAVGYTGRMGVFISNQANGWTITGNTIRDNAVEHADQDGLSIGNLSGSATVTNNYFFHNLAQGIDLYNGPGGNTIQNNTFDQNGWGLSETSAIRLYGTNNTVSYNLIENNTGSGIVVVSADSGAPNAASTGNLISKNSFSNNGKVAIDLVVYTGPGPWKPEENLGDGVTLNGATDANSGNLRFNFPVIGAASLAGTNLTVSGTAPANSTVEIYRAAGTANDQSGGAILRRMSSENN